MFTYSFILSYNRYGNRLEGVYRRGWRFFNWRKKLFQYKRKHWASRYLSYSMIWNMCFNYTLFHSLSSWFPLCFYCSPIFDIFGAKYSRCSDNICGNIYFQLNICFSLVWDGSKHPCICHLFLNIFEADSLYIHATHVQWLRRSCPRQYLIVLFHATTLSLGLSGPLNGDIHQDEHAATLSRHSTRIAGMLRPVWNYFLPLTLRCRPADRWISIPDHVSVRIYLKSFRTG